MLHSWRKKPVKWITFDAFLRSVIFVLMFFQEELASLLSILSTGRPFPDNLEKKKKKKNFPFGVNHVHDTDLSKYFSKYFKP